MWLVELRQLTGLLLVFVPVAAAMIVFGGDSTAGVSLWVEVDHAVAYLPSLAAPVVAALAAWRAGRDPAYGTDVLFESGPRPVRRHLVAVLTLASFAVLGVVAGWVVISGFTAAGNPTWGRPSPGFMLGAAAVVAAAAVWGYAAGSLGPRSIVSPAVAVVVYCSMWLITLAPAPWFRLAPVPDTYFIPSRPGDAADALLIAVLFTTVGIVGLVCIAARHRTRFPWLRVLLATLSLAAIAVAVAESHLDWLTDGQPAPPTCRETRPSVCVHPAYIALIDELAVATGPVSKLNDAEGAPRKLYFGYDQMPEQPDASAVSAGIVVIDDRVDVRQTVDRAIGRALDGEDCDPAPLPSGEPSLQAIRTAASWVALLGDDAAISLAAGFGHRLEALSREFASRDDDIFLARVLRDLPALRACDPDATRDLLSASTNS